MYKKKQEQKAAAPMMNPRISFSNDFAESSSHNHTHNNINLAAAYRDAPVSSDFEFSVNKNSMMSADELFSKGKILPFKGKTTTLRDELGNEEERDDFSSKPPKNPSRLRGFFGLRRPNASKKCTKNSQESDE